MKTYIVLLVSILSSCGQALHSTKGGNANNSSIKKASSSAPMIPLESSTFSDGAKVGPFSATILFLNYPEDPRAGHNITLRYSSFASSSPLSCTGERLKVGVVQNGSLVGTYPIHVVGRGSCDAIIPIDNLQNGIIEVFAFDDRGNYDSNSSSLIRLQY
jgi:hypothetical protein